MYKQKLGIKDWDFQQEEMMSEFKEEIEHNFIFGQRAVDSQSGLAKYSMDGFLNQIKTNVAVYDPATITDYETLIQNYMMLNAKYNTPEAHAKIKEANGIPLDAEIKVSLKDGGDELEIEIVGIEFFEFVEEA